jgi:hypothetical protein
MRTNENLRSTADDGITLYVFTAVLPASPDFRLGTRKVLVKMCGHRTNMRVAFELILFHRPKVSNQEFVTQICVPWEQRERPSTAYSCIVFHLVKKIMFH